MAALAPALNFGKSPVSAFWARLAALLPFRKEQNDPQAIQRRAEAILITHGDRILRYAYTFLHNTADAEEVLQDTLVQFLKHAPEFTDPLHEKAWLLRVAGNLSKNRLRRNALRRTDPLLEELAAQEREDLSFVWEAVKKLPENQRAAIHLHYYEGFSTREIAAILKQNESTVRSHLHRGREALKTYLKEEHPDETVF